VTKEMYQCDLT